MDGNMNPQYLSRINKVLDFIEANIEKQFTLAELSQVSGFSQFHFSRIFSGAMNETLFSYITRLKLEKAKAWLQVTPQKSITDIALDFGFTDSSDFARAFSRVYGISATEYRKLSKKSQDIQSASPYNSEKNKNGSEKEMDLDYKVEIERIEATDIMYLRHVGTYKGFAKKFQQMTGKLFAYAIKNKLTNAETKLLTIYHDNPSITPEEQVRTSVCLTLPKGTKVHEKFGLTTIPAGTYAVGNFILDNGQQQAKAWQLMYGEWLPKSGYQPADGVVFEVYGNDPKTHPQKKSILYICLPVKSL